MPPIDLSKLKLWFTISTAHWKIRRGVLLLPYCRGTFLSSNSTMHGGTLVLSWLQFFTSFHLSCFYLMSWTSCLSSMVFKTAPCDLFRVLITWSHHRLIHVHPFASIGLTPCILSQNI
jgi:hypothetical protein